MAKTEIKTIEVKALDKTNQSWYSKNGSKKITFCNSIDDIIEGKGETLEIKERIETIRNVKKDNVISQITQLIIFTLIDNRFVIVRKNDELK